MKRSISMPDVLIVEARFRGRVQQVVVNRRFDFEIPVNGAVPEFDFEGAKFPAVSDRGERGGFDRNPLDPRDNAYWFGSGCRISVETRRGEKKNRQCNGG